MYNIYTCKLKRGAIAKQSRALCRPHRLDVRSSKRDCCERCRSEKHGIKWNTVAATVTDVGDCTCAVLPDLPGVSCVCSLTGCPALAPQNFDFDSRF